MKRWTNQELHQSSFTELMIKDLDFFIQYLSVHFPFTEAEVLEYWDVLIHGDAFYSVFLQDTQWCYSPKLGVCFNQNIRWTDNLRAKWQVGFDDPYNGYFIGVGKTPIQYDDIEDLRKLLPLSISKQRLAMEVAMMDYANCHGHLEMHLESACSEEESKKENKYTQEFPRLCFDDFQKLYEENKSNILYNRSIWFNTLYYEINANDVMRLFRLKRYLKQET